MFSVGKSEGRQIGQIFLNKGMKNRKRHFNDALMG